LSRPCGELSLSVYSDRERKRERGHIKDGEALLSMLDIELRMIPKKDF
jgi:hypothetical protein